jgi:hypothetical protein
MKYILVAYFLSNGAPQEVILSEGLSLKDCGLEIAQEIVSYVDGKGNVIEFPHSPAFACEVTP